MPQNILTADKKHRKLFGGLSDTNLLMTITIIVFILMYLFAIIGLGAGFQKPQTFFNILNANALSFFRAE